MGLCRAKFVMKLVFCRGQGVFWKREDQWNPKYGCTGTVTTRFALIALVAWHYSFDSTLRKLFVHPKYD